MTLVVLVALLLLAAVPADPGWTWPLGAAGSPPVVVRGFDPPSVPWGRGHRGVDLAGSVGDSVRAAGAGTVVFAGAVAGRGVVSVGHPGGLRTTYEPVDPLVEVGARVRPGDELGRLTFGGHCDGRCLHWGARRGLRYVDPLRLLQPGPVRLLPLRSGPGVRLLVGAPEPVDAHVGVALRRGDRGVPEQLLDRPEVRPALE